MTLFFVWMFAAVPLRGEWITAELCDKIQVGMPMRQVVSTLRCRPGNYAGPGFSGSYVVTRNELDGTELEWIGLYASILIRFDEKGTVVWYRRGLTYTHVRR